MKAAPHAEPFDPEAPVEGPPVLIIGCGNLLRGDDAAGPILIRKLWDIGVGDLVGANAQKGKIPRLVDGGTAGMDVAFQMRGARHVILIDACSGTGDEPGTIFRVPGEAIAELPAPTDIHSHSFRWDHALSFAKWLLKDEYPDTIEVWLIEGESYAHGAELKPRVAAAVDDLSLRIAKDVKARLCID